jgi:hypothetical protein
MATCAFFFLHHVILSSSASSWLRSARARSTVIMVVGLNYAPRTNIEEWARDEALARYVRMALVVRSRELRGREPHLGSLGGPCRGPVLGGFRTLARPVGETVAA